MTESLAYPSEYLSTLQDVAQGFLKRNQAAHLGEQTLFSHAVNYLVTTMNCNKAIAENMVARAYGDIKRTDDRYLDLSTSTANMAMLVDPKSGLHYAVPVGIVFQMIIDSPARRRLCAVAATTH